MGWSLAISQAKTYNMLTDFRLFAAFIEIGLQNGELRAQFIDLVFSALNAPDQTFGVVVQANVKDEQKRDPQNAVNVLNWPGVIFAEKPIQADGIIEPGCQFEFAPLLLLLGDPFGLTECIFGHGWVRTRW